MKKHLPEILLLIIGLAGVCLLCYPTASDFVNRQRQQAIVDTYSEAAASIDEELYEETWNSAVAYNELLLENGSGFALSDSEYVEYESQLNILGTGVMACVEIPAIDLYLPVYHGTDDSVLAVALGHLAGSSLPVGGENTHCVIYGHTGLSSARIFTDLNDLEIGDVFMIHTLSETLTYEVDQILTVLPDETEELEIVPGQDLCTLVTCTPYGINDHRLFVRGHRIENLTDEEIKELYDTSGLFIMIIVTAACTLVVFCVMMIAGKKRRRKKS